jgi:hypothetical protein
MGIFNKLFGGKKTNTGPMPTRKMNFQFSLIPENGPNFSEQFRSAVKSNEDLNLDFSVESLKFVDSFLQRFKDEGLSVDDFAETIFVAGCYVGQVMVHNNAGVWIKEEDANLPDGVTMMPLVIRLSNNTITDPIAKSFKRFYNGEVDSIPYYYTVFTSGNSEG